MTASFVPALISAAALQAQLRRAPGMRLLDVRTHAEFETAHIAGAYNVPLDTLSEHAADIRGSSAEAVVLVCQSGQRARKAETALNAAGAPTLLVLDGGMNGWIAGGHIVVRGTPRMSLERQVRIAAGALAAAGAALALLVNPLFALVPAFVGSGLVFAGMSDTCVMGMLLARLPLNRPAGCDVSAAVRALAAGEPSPAREPSRPPVACCAG